MRYLFTWIIFAVSRAAVVVSGTIRIAIVIASIRVRVVIRIAVLRPSTVIARAVVIALRNDEQKKARIRE